jgi:hypothetical protein
MEELDVSLSVSNNRKKVIPTRINPMPIIEEVLLFLLFDEYFFSS